MMDILIVSGIMVGSAYIALSIIQFMIWCCK